MKKLQMIKRILLLVCLFVLSINVNALKIPEKEKKFFKAFTQKKRNINTVKLEYLERFFPLVGLDKQDAQNIYRYQQQTPITSVEDFLTLSGITKEKIKILQQYFVFEKPEEKEKDVPEAKKTTVSQEAPEEEVDDIVETLIEDSEEEEDETKDVLQKYKDSPLDLSQASMSDLTEFPFLSPILALRIIQYRDKKGFNSVPDLKNVEGLTDDIYNQIAGFVTVKKPFIVVEGKKVKKKPAFGGKITFRFVADHPYSEEYLKNGIYNRYIHNPVGLKEKVELHYGQLAEAGFIMERDVGEEDLNDMQKYFIQFNNLWYVKKLIFGNYRLYFGQGLVLSSPGGSAKGGEVVRIKEKSKGIKADLTSSENAYFFGPALQLEFSDLTLYGFYSFKKHDATLEDQGSRLVSSDYDDDTPEDDSDNIITSFDTEDDGRHLTGSDRKKIDNLERKFIGSRIEYSVLQTLKIGSTYYHSTYSVPLNPEVKNNYYYKFRGDWLDVAGFDFDFIYHSMNLFGEVAVSFFPRIQDPVFYDPYDPSNTDEKDTSLGFLIGNVIDVGQFETALLYRKYDRDFYNFDNGAFQESDDQNEEGVYWANRLKLDRQTKIWMYIDAYRMDWRKYYEIMPTRGYEVYSQIERKFLSKFKYTVRGKIENKDMKVTTEQGSEVFWVQNDWRIRNEIQWEPSKNIRYRLRYEFSRTEYEDLDILYNGYLVFADIRYSPTTRLTFYLRDIIFDTPYEARIWEYENTIPSYMENLAFYGTGRGNRLYLMLKDKVDENLLWNLKIARTTYFEATSIQRSDILGEDEEESESEVAETVLGNSQYDFRMEIQYKF
ncbi:MAG: helix-hairpin-helix domain-containing protein [Spirochaetes bacterium]|nr:helix-hairpin-helix domain-containing protein [Spirochaetota bacterium]